MGLVLDTVQTEADLVVVAVRVRAAQLARVQAVMNLHRLCYGICFSLFLPFFFFASYAANMHFYREACSQRSFAAWYRSCLKRVLPVCARFYNARGP